MTFLYWLKKKSLHQLGFHDSLWFDSGFVLMRAFIWMSFLYLSLLLGWEILFFCSYWYWFLYSLTICCSNCCCCNLFFCFFFSSNHKPTKPSHAALWQQDVWEARCKIDQSWLLSFPYPNSVDIVCILTVHHWLHMWIHLSFSLYILLI